jgi:hypothetical protein
MKICPVCKGCGKIKNPVNLKEELALRKKTVIEMRKQGYTFYEIMYVTGYKSPRSISKILTHETKKA